MITVGVIGASGFTGHELVKLLTTHKKVSLQVINSHTLKGKKISEIYPDFLGDDRYTDFTLEEINAKKLDLLFLALPHGYSAEIASRLNSSLKIIDLGAEFRFADIKKYEAVYHVKSPMKKNSAIYGLPELNKKKISHADIVANPGCYATACLLSVLPIQNFAKYIVFDCKSGWSGAGKESVYAKNPELLKENLIPYNLTHHRHKYEIEQFISPKISFTPHVINTFRGLLCTAHILLKKKIKKERLMKIYAQFYKDAPFVEISKEIPEITNVQKTNICKIGGFEIDENNQLVMVSVIDNLLKGASGQAVQNMNIMFGFNEDEGLL